jgi:hypothetical protein
MTQKGSGICVVMSMLLSRARDNDDEDDDHQI